LKLLILTNKPERASCKQRVGVHLSILRSKGIDCEIVTFPSGVFKRLKLIKHSGNFDGIFLQKKRLRLCDAIWVKRYCRKIIYDLDDAVMYSDKTPEQDSWSRQRRFKRTVQSADMVIAGNSYLAKHAEQFNPNVRILPTGLNVAEYNCDVEQLQKDGKIRLVWIGSKNTLKYLSEITPALEKVGSRFDNVVLRIICNHFFDLQNMEVEKCRWSLQSQAGDLATSDIGLAPLPDDRFTRGKCGFKILQYAAASLPVVASPVGVNTEYVDDGITGFHASQPDEWIDRITKLVEKPELRRRMGQAGREQVGQFDVDFIGKKLCDLIMGCLGTDHSV
jgi:glycosyltransferase involved in cell wall biosynthesis